MIELRLLRYFVAVAETQHVGRAAERLHISQSPLSRQIQQLEEELELKLFARERRGVQLTDAGRWLLQPARELLARAEGLKREAHQALDQSAKITIGFIGTAVTSGVLPAALRALRERRPLVRVALRHWNTADQVAALHAGEIDLALVYRGDASVGLRSRQIFEQPYELAVARAGPLARKPLNAQLLSNAPWIAVRSGEVESARWLAALSSAQVSPQISVEVADWASALSLVDAGMGIALVPRSQRAIAPRGVIFREVDWLQMASQLWIVQRAGTTPLLEELAIDLLRGAATAGARPAHHR